MFIAHLNGWLVLALCFSAPFHHHLNVRLICCNSYELPTQPFIIEVAHVTGDPIVGYLDTTGETHNLCRLASQWQILDGHLLEKGGLQCVSVGEHVPVAKFSSTGTHGMSVDTNFAVAPSGNLSWQNAAFADGSAVFGTDADGIVYAVFEGSLPSNLSAVSLKALNGKHSHAL